MSESMPMFLNEQIIAAREKAGFTRACVAGKLNLPLAVIDALEEGEYNFLYGDAFVFGVIRGYAGLLDISAESWITAYKLLKSHEASIKIVDDVNIQRQPSWNARFFSNVIFLDQRYRAVCGIALIIALAVLIRMTSVSDVTTVEKIVDTVIVIDTSGGSTVTSSLDAMPINVSNLPDVELFSRVSLMPPSVFTGKPPFWIMLGYKPDGVINTYSIYVEKPVLGNS